MSSAAVPLTRELSLAPRSSLLVPGVIGALVFIVAVSTVTPWPVGAFEDDAIYTVLAKALAEGEGYRLVNLPGAPNATHFPPGYPAFLALLWRAWPVFPDNLVLFKFANALLLAAAAAGTYVFATGRLGLTRAWAAVSALAATLSVVILLLSGMVLSEPMFLALLAPSLLITERAIETGRVRTALLAGALLGGLALVRTLGLFAVPVALVLLLWRRRHMAATALAAGAALLIVPWQVWVALHQNEIPPIIAGKYGSYTGWVAQGYAQGGFGFVWAVLARNARDLFQVLSFLHAPVDVLWPRIVAFAALVGIFALGSRALWRRAPVTLGFVLVYFAVVLIWPFEPNRFLLGIWPILALAVALGVRDLVRWRPATMYTKGLRIAAFALAAGLAVGYGTYNARGYTNSWWVRVQRQGGERLKPIAEWVAHNTALTDVIATDHDPAVYLYTGRRAVPTSTWMVRERIKPLTPEEDVQAVRALLLELAPNYYVPTSVIGMRTATALARETPPVLRYLGPTPNGAAFAFVRR
ncbi:MAG TPA: hypothetical protein VJ717_14325 [Gemmatimonadaceae bacterium]|nr:hypothetical protein [Gemmatimonadaceae bacterium]